MRARGHLTAALISVSLASCAHYSQEEGEKLANEVYALTTQLQALQKSLREQQKTAERHDEQIDAMSTEVETLNRAARRNDADLGVLVDQIRQDLASFKGLVEGTKERTDLIEQELSRLKEDMKVASAQSEEAKQKAIEDAKTRERILGNPETLVGEVAAKINAQKLDEARSLVREFLLRAKDNKALERWADEAQYLLGETYFASGDYKRAATEYNTVRKRWPKSSKVPDALFRMGQCFEKLNLPEDAKLFYQTLRKQHAKSAAAKKAQERLRELRGSR